jgi:molybdopterin-binding protein
VQIDLTAKRKADMTIKAINVRNQFKGVIKEILLGEVVSEIDVQTASGIVTSVITTRSVRDLELKVGTTPQRGSKSWLSRTCRSIQRVHGFYERWCRV